MLRAKCIDFLISNDRNFKHFLTGQETDTPHKVSEVLALEPPLELRDLYIAFSKKTPESLIASFDKSLKKAIQGAQKAQDSYQHEAKLQSHLNISHNVVYGVNGFGSSREASVVLESKL